MIERVVKDKHDIRNLLKLISNRSMPFTVKIFEGVKRTPAQNKLQRLWFKEAEEQIQDMRAEDYRAYCKLHFGVPILRNEDDEFKAAYNKVLLGLTYEQKLLSMRVPLDFPVTRLMNTKQKTKYLDDAREYLQGLGVILTIPESER